MRTVEQTEETLAMLENERLAARNSATWWMLDERKRAQYVERAELYAHAAACVREVATLRAEVEQLRPHEAFVRAIDSGEIDTVANSKVPMGQPTGVIVFRRDGKGFTAPDALSAWAKAKRETGL